MVFDPFSLVAEPSGTITSDVTIPDPVYTLLGIDEKYIVGAIIGAILISIILEI